MAGLITEQKKTCRRLWVVALRHPHADFTSNLLPIWARTSTDPRRPNLTLDSYSSSPQRPWSSKRKSLPSEKREGPSGPSPLLCNSDLATG